MSLGEGAARTRLQVPLQSDCARFISEFDDDVELPRSPRCRVTAAAIVMRGETRVNVRCQTGVVARRIIGVLEDVDKALRDWHGCDLDVQDSDPLQER